MTQPPASDDDLQSAEPGAGPAGTYAVRVRRTWRGAGQIVAFLILVLASAGFVAGGVMRGGEGWGSIMFMVLGVLGFVTFGAGLLATTGRVLGRRPVLELTAEGVRRPARWPLPGGAGKVLPWTSVEGMAAVRRGVPGTRRGEQDYLVFLPTAALVELSRTAERSHLVALTLTDVPATAAAADWCFAVEESWDAPLKEIVRQARLRRRVPVVDRRSK